MTVNYERKANEQGDPEFSGSTSSKSELVRILLKFGEDMIFPYCGLDAWLSYLTVEGKNKPERSLGYP